MAGYIINFVVSLLVGAIFILWGWHQCRSKTPAVMNTGQKPLKPEQLRDVKAWNTKHGKAFIVFGAVVAVTTAVFPFVLDCVNAGIAAAAYCVVITLEIVCLLAYHGRLEQLYRIY